jgi:hypothetical protein
MGHAGSRALGFARRRAGATAHPFTSAFCHACWAGNSCAEISFRSSFALSVIHRLLARAVENFALRAVQIERFENLV